MLEKIYNSNSCFLEIAGVRLWKTAVLSMHRANYPIRNQDFLLLPSEARQPPILDDVYNFYSCQIPARPMYFSQSKSQFVCRSVIRVAFSDVTE